VTAKGSSVFLTDAGVEISVRTAHTSGATTTLEPLYAADSVLLDGVTGELRGEAGERLRGTLRRRGNVFALSREQPQEKGLEETKATSPSRASMAALSAELGEQSQESAPSQAEAIEAAKTVAQFLRGEPNVSLKAAKQAQAKVGRFIAERERESEHEDD
jgi:hypothetical protein